MTATKKQVNKCKVQKVRSGNSPPKKRLRPGAHFFLCHFCDITFPTKEERFFHHETIHLEGAVDMNEGGTTRLYSTICGKASLIPGQITAHNETFHANHFKFICLSCKPERRQFTSHDLLKAHQVIHTPDSSSFSFPCLLCKESPLTLSSAVDLDNHLRRFHFHSLKYSHSHGNSVGRECDNPCLITNKVQRGFHVRVDPCRFCGFRVSRRGLFGTRIHERKEHPEKFVHLCPHPNCGESYAEVKELLTCQESHKTSQEEGQFKCFVCNGRLECDLLND